MRNEIRSRITSSDDTVVDLSNMNIDDREIQEIANEIKTLRPKVQTISLANNNIGDAGAEILGKELKILSSLSSLNLMFNKIDKSGAFAIAALKNNLPDLTIALHGNKITNESEMEDIRRLAMPGSKR